jgi:hypothetical protein
MNITEVLISLGGKWTYILVGGAESSFSAANIRSVNFFTCRLPVVVYSLHCRMPIVVSAKLDGKFGGYYSVLLDTENRH